MAFATPAEVYLDELIATDDPEMKARMLEDLRDVTGRDFGSDILRWIAWVQNNPRGKQNNVVSEEMRNDPEAN